jgi:polysaccharide deacetylase 2 family uncharacterized protein YibQ
MSNPERSSPRGLALATGLVAFAVFAGIIGIAILGAPTPQPGVTLPLDQAPGTGTAPPPSGIAIREVNGNLVSDLALIEDSPDGPLPRIAADGRRPMTAYTKPFTPPAPARRIAIVLTGLGVSDSQTQLALTRLPPEVTLSFVPSISGLQPLVDQARGRGHEVLIELPMEPFDFPDSDPGPNGLMTTQPPAENLRRLHWNMSRATGYVGVGNLLGGRFLGDAAALAPVMGDVAQRGLLFFDNGRNAGSLAPEAAMTTGAPIAVGNLVIDDVQTPGAIELQLTELEAQAARDGSAIGVASVYPVTLERLEAWAAGLSARGFALAPLTAVTQLPAP